MLGGTEATAEISAPFGGPPGKNLSAKGRGKMSELVGGGGLLCHL